MTAATTPDDRRDAASSGRRVAAYFGVPFLRAGLAPLIGAHAHGLLTSSIVDLIDFEPDVIVVNHEAAIRQWRAYCDAHHAYLVALRHGAANKYIGPDPEFGDADYFCGSEWDRGDLASHGVAPRRGFLLTGNPWLDEVFALPRRSADTRRPTFLLAPTWNAETSAAAVFDQRYLDALRDRFPGCRLIVKPHPIVLETSHPLARDLGHEAEFSRWLSTWRAMASGDPDVVLDEDATTLARRHYADADVLISDGSSLVLEFITLGRPVMLYVNDVPVEVWKTRLDPTAPAFSMRGVGAQFSDLPGFQAALSSLIADHEARHAAAQRGVCDLMFGRFGDAGSGARVRDAVAALPRLRLRLPCAGPGGFPALRRRVTGLVRNAVLELGPRGVSAIGADRCCTIAGALADNSEVGSAAELLGESPARRDLVLTVVAKEPVLENGYWALADEAVVEVTRSGLRDGARATALFWLTVKPTGVEDPRPLPVRVDAGEPDFDHTWECPRGTAAATLVAVPLHEGSTRVTVRPAGGPAVHAAGPSASRVAYCCCEPAGFSSIAALPQHEWDRLLPVLVAAERHEAASLMRLLPSREQPRFLDQLGADVVAEAPHPGWDLDLALTVLGGWLSRRLRAEGIRRVAFHGAGSHSTRLRAVWDAYDGPEVAVLMETGAPRRTEIEGTPVIALDALHRVDVDAVVLSSRWYESEMLAACGERAPGLPVFPLWHHVPDDPGESRHVLDVLLMRRIVPALVRRVAVTGKKRVRLSGPDSLLRLALPVWMAHGADVTARSWSRIAQVAPAPPTAGEPDREVAEVYCAPRNCRPFDVGDSDVWLRWPAA